MPPPAKMIAGNGIVRGRVTFAGDPPVMKPIAGGHCEGSDAPILDESAIVGTGGGLKDVLVSIEGIGPGAARSESPVLDQVGCRYVPHVLGAVAGQQIDFRSSDQTMHNVHLIGPAGDLSNFALAPGKDRGLAFGQPQIIHVKCDVHPWMSAYIGVFENPFFAVTGDDGKFEITGVPAGTYKLSIWHEQYGKQEQNITVSDDKPAEVNVTYGKQ
jgi:hypothetical protein